MARKPKETELPIDTPQDTGSEDKPAEGTIARAVADHRARLEKADKERGW